MLLKKKRIKIRKNIAITFNRIKNCSMYCNSNGCTFFNQNPAVICELCETASKKYGVSEPYLCEFTKFRIVKNITKIDLDFTYLPDCNAIKEI